MLIGGVDRFASTAGDNRYFIQKIAIDVQSGNATSKEKLPIATCVIIVMSDVTALCQMMIVCCDRHTTQKSMR